MCIKFFVGMLVLACSIAACSIPGQITATTEPEVPGAPKQAVADKRLPLPSRR